MLISFFFNAIVTDIKLPDDRVTNIHMTTLTVCVCESNNVEFLGVDSMNNMKILQINEHIYTYSCTKKQHTHLIAD